MNSSRIPRALAALALAVAACGALPAAAQAPAQAATPAVTAPAADTKPLVLSLSDAIVRAMKNNLSVAVQVLNPAKSMEGVTLANEKFMPSLQFQYNKRNTENASYSFLDASESVKTLYDQYTVSLNQQIPFGGTLAVSLDNYVNETTQSFQTINPRYGSTLRFTFSQPLLRGFGYDLSRREILIARNSLSQSQDNLEQALLDTIYSVEDAYWNLLYSIETLDVRKQSLQLAQDLLDKNKRSVEVGTLAPMDIVSAQAEVATREADIIAAEAAVKNAEDRVKTLLNYSAEEQKTIGSLVPADTPDVVERTMNPDEALAVALQNRPDLRSARTGLETTQLNLRQARNQMLPGLSLNAQYWSPGISGTQILYDGNPLNGIVIGQIPGGFSNAFNDATGFKYQNWSIGLTLDIPVSSVFTRAAYAQSKINMQQALLQVKTQEQQVYLDVKTAVRAVDTNYKRINAYKVARELAEQKLQAEEEKLKVGLSTNYLVLTYQRDLANAKLTENRAVVDYNLSLAALDRALGTGLKAKNMRLTDFLPGDGSTPKKPS